MYLFYYFYLNSLSNTLLIVVIAFACFLLDATFAPHILLYRAFDVSCAYVSAAAPVIGSAAPAAAVAGAAAGAP